MKIIKLLVWAIKNRKVLVELAKAYCNQDNRGTAFPIFYQIRDWKYELVAEGCDGDCIHITEDGECFVQYNVKDDGCEEEFSIDNFLQKHCKAYGIDTEQITKNEEWSELIQEVEDGCDMKTQVETLCNYFNEKFECDYRVYEVELRPVYKGCFLTEQDAEEHLKLNDYHYHKKADTWCAPAWRSSTMNKLNKLFEELNNVK